MKFSTQPFWPRLPGLVLAGGMFLASYSGVAASDDDRINGALSTAQNWVRQVDAGQYDVTYDEGCDALHHKVTREIWVKALRTLRAPWGLVASRQQTGHFYRPDGVQGLSGECMVITYDTTFKRLDSATETLVLKWEDGQWRTAGYTAGSKPGTGGTVDPEDIVHTEVSSQTIKAPRPPASGH